MASKKSEVVFIASAYGRWPMLEYELDIAQRELDSGSTVVFGYCGGSRNYCNASQNINGPLKRHCNECISRVKTGIKWLSNANGRLILKRIDDVNCRSTGAKASKAWDRIKKIPSLKYTQVYNAAISTLMTEIRDPYPQIEENKKIIISLILDGLCSRKFNKKLNADYDVKKIYVFNGRIAHYNPFLVLNAEKEVIVVEYPWYGFNDYLLLEGFYPHDLVKLSKKILQNAYDPSVPIDIKVAMGDEYFKKRLATIKIDSTGTYSFIQKIDSGLKRDTKKKISIFISSEDELGGVREFYENALYPNQLEGLRSIFRAVDSEVLIIVRMHPRLNGVENSYIKKMQDLINQYSNILYFSASSNVDSYEIVGISDAVITFGSTIGAEAAYLGVPAFQLAPAGYTSFGCNYIPNDEQDFFDGLKKVLIGKRLIDQEIAKTNAILYAYGLMKMGVKPQYTHRIDYNNANMIRGAKTKKIKANVIYRTINFILDILPFYLILVVKNYRKIPRKVKLIYQHFKLQS